MLIDLKEKFTFDECDVRILTKEAKTLSLDGDSCKNVKLKRELSGSDEKLNCEVSEGWNPLSPISVDCETEAERLISSRCGSHASSSLRTVDSMTNVTRMTVSSIDLSPSSSNSDSFSSVSSVQQSSDSEDDAIEDYQHQWNVLWKKHYEEEYLEQYNKFITLYGSNNVDVKKSKSKAINKSLHKVKENLFTADGKSLVDSIDSLFGDLKVKTDNIDESSSDFDDDQTIQTELNEMKAMGLPLSFCKINTQSSIKKST